MNKQFSTKAEAEAWLLGGIDVVTLVLEEFRAADAPEWTVETIFAEIARLRECMINDYSELVSSSMPDITQLTSETAPLSQSLEET